MRDSWLFAGGDAKSEPYDPESFFAEVRKLSGMSNKTVEKRPPKSAGIVMGRDQAGLAEHVLRMAGQPFEMLDHGDFKVRFLVMDRDESLRLLERAGVKVESSENEVEISWDRAQTVSKRVLQGAKRLSDAVAAADADTAMGLIRLLEDDLRNMKAALA
jgi:hypothetical protein